MEPFSPTAATPASSVSPSITYEPTPEILLRNTLIDGLLNRSQSIGLYTSVDDVIPRVHAPAPSTFLISTHPLGFDPHYSGPPAKAPSGFHSSSLQPEKAKGKASHLQLNEAFVRSSSTGVNFGNLPSNYIDMLASSTSVSPTGFTDPGLSRSWSPISSADDGTHSADSRGELVDSSSTALEQSTAALYTPGRLLKLEPQSRDEDSSVDATPPLDSHHAHLPGILADTTTPVLSLSSFLAHKPSQVKPDPTISDLPSISITTATGVSDSMVPAQTVLPQAITRRIVDRPPSSHSDIYVSAPHTFESFSASQAPDKIEAMAAPFRADFTDMFTASQLASLKYIVDLAKDDPHHVLLGLRYALEQEILLRQKQLNVVKNWNKEFWKLVRLPDNEVKFQAMRALAQDFVFTSETYGRLIISEMYLPPSEKTVHPMKLGGIAGGQKFVCQGILFKFAMDVALDAHGSTVWMYGGAEPCNEYAMKSAKHEFNGIIALNNLRWQGIGNIRVALTTIIDFRGFRLVCQALLPIGKNTLVYGSDNGGNTHLDDPGFRTTMKQVSETLNLKSHSFTPAHQPSRQVYGPVDLEGHRVRKALYAVDLARLFPPESPRLSLAPKTRSQFFRMLRPELVKRFHKPLSSDAHTAFGRDDHGTNNAEVDDATLYLQNTVIPGFAETLASKQHLKQYTDGSILVRELHRWGINVRYLGAVRARLSSHNATARQIVLLEMVLRCLKNMFRRRLRKQMEVTRISVDSPYAEVVLELLNLFLGKDENSKVFWRVTIKEALREMFVVGLTDDELSSAVSLKRDLNMQALLDRFQVLTGVKLIPSASTYRKGKSDLILYTDLEAVQNTVTKHMQIVDYAEGALLLLLSEKKTDQAEKLRLLSLAENRLKLARSSAMGNQSLYQLGQVFYMRHKVAPKLDLNDVLNALTYYRAVIDSSSDEAHLMVSLKHTLELYYGIVSSSIWLQKKLFGSNMISPAFLPLPSPSLLHSTVDTPIEAHSSTQSNALGATTTIAQSTPTHKSSGELKHARAASADSPRNLYTSSASSDSSSPKSSGQHGSKDSPNKEGSPRESSTRASLQIPGSFSKLLSSTSDADLISSMAIMRSSNVSGQAISLMFHQHCCAVFEKLASLNYKDAVKDAARYVKDACQRQGDSLRWIFEVSLHSPFVRDRLRLYLQRQPSLSVPHCPQLFSSKQNSVVYRFLQNMKASSERRKFTKSNHHTKRSPNGSQDNITLLPTTASKSITAIQPDLRSSLSLEQDSLHQDGLKSRHANSMASLPTGDAPSPNDSDYSLRHSTSDHSPRNSESLYANEGVSYKLPNCLALNLTECSPVTSTVLTAILSETPYLQILILDHCSKISNKLASILAPQSGKRGPIYLRELSLVQCSKITDGFFHSLTPLVDIKGELSPSPGSTPLSFSLSNSQHFSPFSSSSSITTSPSTNPPSFNSSATIAVPGGTSPLNYKEIPRTASGTTHHRTSSSNLKDSNGKSNKRRRSQSTTGPNQPVDSTKTTPNRESKEYPMNVTAAPPTPMSSSSSTTGHHKNGRTSVEIANGAVASAHSTSQRNLHRQQSSSSSSSSLPPGVRQLNLLRDITSLNLNGCRQLTDEALHKISQVSAKLVDLDMSYSKVSDLTPLHVTTSLRRLLVSSTMVRDNALHAFIKTDTFKALYECQIASCSLTDHALAPLDSNIHLRTLNMTENKVGDKILSTLSQFAPHLSDLNVGTVDLQDRAVLVTMAEKLPHLTRLKMVHAQNGINGAIISMQKSHVPIQHLEVPWCSVRDIVVHGLAQAFPHLQSVDLTGSQLSNAPLEKLKACANLTSLNLSWCTQLVDPTILDITAGCTSLSSLAIAHCQQVTSHCLHNLPNTLISLDLSHCPNIADLGPIRSQCIHLANLNLASCAISEDNLLGLFGAGISLHSINLKGCKQVGDKFVVRMAKYCPILSKAILDECTSITEEGLIPLLTECPYIQRLTLTGVAHLSDRSIVHAISYQGMRHIKELNLSGCKNITDASVFAIARNCALLNDLSLSGCVNITSKSVIELADSCQILLTLNIFGCKLIRADIVTHLAQHCKLLEKVIGVMNSGVAKDASLNLKNLPFLIE